MLYEFGGLMLKEKYVPIWERKDGSSGFAMASPEAWYRSTIMLAKRGAKPLARLTAVVPDRANRQPGTITQALSRL